MTDCKCGCGAPVRARRKFVNMQHQLTWMRSGGAAELTALQPLHSKQLGGSRGGTTQAKSGQLDAKRAVSNQRVRAIARQSRGDAAPGD